MIQAPAGFFAALGLAILWFGAGLAKAGDPTWTRGGNALWYSQTNITHDGVSAERSGTITDSQTTWIEATFTGPGVVCFWWKVSSEQDYDMLRFSIGGVETATTSGEVDWEPRAYPIGSGTQTLRWTYSKDGSLGAGSDCAFLDEVALGRTITWGGSVSSDWNNSSNWSPAVVPGLADTVLITKGSVTATTNARFNLLSVQGGTLVGPLGVADGKKMDWIGGRIGLADGLTSVSVKSNGSLRIAGNSLSGGASVMVAEGGQLIITNGANVALASLSLTNAAAGTIGGGASLMVSGTLSVWSNAVVTCQGLNRTSGSNGLGVAINAGNVVVAEGARITADAWGYAGTTTTGLGPGKGGYYSSIYGGGGAGYGGLGGYGSGGYASRGAMYGSSSQPADFGSSGGYNGGSGGGAIWVNATNQLTFDGLITANGSAGTGGYSGGGSGGSIYLQAGMLSGKGYMQVNGGNGATNGGGGAGGRIAVNCSAGNYTNLSSCTANGGTGFNTGANGSKFFSIAGSNSLYVGNLLTVSNQVVSYGTVEMAPGATLLVAAGGVLTADRLWMGSNGVLAVAGGQLVCGSGLTVNGSLWVTNGGTAELTDLVLTNGTGMTLDGLSQLRVSGSLTVCTNAVVTCQGGNRTTGNGGLGVVINASNLVVAEGGLITADGWGYVGTSTNGLGLGGGGSASTSGGGGGYGGKGGSGRYGYAGGTYGSAAQPTDLGSSGGYYGGSGGGVIRLEVTNRLVLDGLVTANGVSGPYNGSGGGSGGSIYARVGVWDGKGSLQANGGSGSSYSDGGGGGGGRVAVTFSGGSYSNFAQCAVTGGSGYNVGSAGTRLFFNTGTNSIYVGNLLAVSNQVVAYGTVEMAPGATVLVTVGGVLTADRLWMGSNAVVAVSGGQLVCGSGLTVNGSLWVTNGGTAELTDLVLTNGTGMTLEGLSQLRVSGSLTVCTNAVVTCQGGHRTSGSVGVGVVINASNLVVAEGGLITADGWGYVGTSTNGLGLGGGQQSYSHYGGGGGYGGKGGDGAEVSAYGGSSYGSAAQPTDLGSSGGSYGGSGGGAIRLEVTNRLVLDGLVTANGVSGPYNGSGGGSGGSILVQARQFDGTGHLQAIGGDRTSYGGGGGGGGGRIAAYYPQGTFQDIQCSVARGIGYNFGLPGSLSFDGLAMRPTNSFAAIGYSGGPFAPTRVTYQLVNTFMREIAWGAASSSIWAEAEPTGGVIPPGGSNSFDVVLTSQASSLLGGNYTGLITVTNSSTVKVTSRPLTLTVLRRGRISVSPASISVTNSPGQLVRRFITVSNLATAEGNLSVTIHTSTNGSGSSIKAADVKAPVVYAVCSVQAGHDFRQIAAGVDHAQDRLLVRFKPSTAWSVRAEKIKTAGASILHRYSTVDSLQVVQLPAGQTVSNALQVWNAEPEVLYAEPDYVVQAMDTIPNDPVFPNLWGLHNTGQTGGKAGADINAPAAWDWSQGSSNIVVAVIDTGIDYRHEDLAGNMWMNPGEIPGNGVDDDGNGFVDDVYGWDFANNDKDPMDDNSHGTHCAGTIGGIGDNGKGVAGVCWKVRIMALKFLDSSGSGYISDAVKCVDYATRKKARLSSNSWGGGGYSQAMKDALETAGINDIAFVAAAGNSASDNDATPKYPCGYDSPNIIAVVAVDSSDALAYFSCYGRSSTDVGAPGVGILSCVPNSSYGTKSGTSMATPHVAGACALLLAANPTLTVPEYKQILMSTVDKTLPGRCASGGRINLGAAIEKVGASWFRISPESIANLQPGQSANLNVVISTENLGPGTYQGELVLESNDPVVPTSRVSVSLTIPDGLSVVPLEPVVSSGRKGGPFVSTNVIYTINNADAASPISFSIAHTQPWLTLSPSSGTIAPAGTTHIVAHLNAAAGLLDVGNYVDTLVFGRAGSSLTDSREVRLEVFTSPELNVGPALLAVTNRLGEITTRTFIVSNTASADGSLSFVAEIVDLPGPQIFAGSNSIPWLTVSPTNASGILPGNQMQVIARFDAAQVPAGEYAAQVLITSNDRYTPQAAVTARLVILAESLALLSPGTFSSSGVEGGPFAPTNTTYTLTNTGQASLTWQAHPTASWLEMTPPTGILAPGGSTIVRAKFTDATLLLLPGLHQASLIFSNESSGAALTVLAAIQVQAKPFVQFPLDVDPGWKWEGDWQFGVPTGAGSAGKDPASGHSGTNVLGYNLLGNYSNNMSVMYLTSDSIDCSGFTNIQVAFWRWLGVEDARFDHACFEVSRDGLVWTTAWTNVSPSLSDTEWVLQQCDISMVADRQPTVYLRWGMGPTDGSVTFPGWNLDDISLSGVAWSNAAPLVLIQLTMDPGGTLSLSLTNPPGLAFTLLSTTNVALPLSSWEQIGTLAEGPSGYYRVHNLQTLNATHRFYRVRQDPP